MYDARHGLSRAIKDIRFTLLASKLTSSSATISMHTHKGHKVETKNFITAQQAVGTSCLRWFPLSPKSQGLCQKTQVDEVQTGAHPGFVSQLGNSTFRELQSFMKVCKQTCPTFALEQYIIFSIWSVNKLALCSGS